MSNGESGSWVAHIASSEVYGQVVATDLFGDAYVIPLLDTFEDIKECLGVAIVGLPSDEDLADAALNEITGANDDVATACVGLPGVDESRTAASVKPLTVLRGEVHVQDLTRHDPPKIEDHGKSASLVENEARGRAIYIEKESDLKESLNADGDDSGIHSMGTASPREAGVLENFSRGINIRAVESGIDTAGYRRVSEEKYHPEACFEKRLFPDFSRRRNCHDDMFNAYDKAEKGLQNGLENPSGTNPPPEVEKMLLFDSSLPSTDSKLVGFPSHQDSVHDTRRRLPDEGTCKTVPNTKSYPNYSRAAALHDNLGNKILQ